MNQLITKLMKLINDAIVSGNISDKSNLIDIINSSNVEDNSKTYLLSILNNNVSFTKLNKELYNYKYKLEQEKKHTKSLKKFRNKEENDVLVNDFKQYENFVYSLISTNNYKSRVSKTQEKVRLLDIHHLFGYDSSETQKDIEQEGRLYVWEGLKKYGVLPEKEKHFKNSTKKRSIASKSTFVHSNLHNNLVNLGKKASSDKFRAIITEFKPEILDGENTDE